MYLTSGAKRVTLFAETVNGCSAQRDSIINVGLVPKANFAWQNECLTGGATVFTSLSDPTNLVRYRWEFADGSTYDGGTSFSSVSHTFTNVGYHTVKMIIESTEMCLDSLEKQVFIQPLLVVNNLAESQYFEDFEIGQGFWDARVFNNTDYYSWNLGTPDGSFINSAASGSNAWHTSIDFENQRVEKSQVVSPCFDLRLLERPMLKFNIWSSPEVGRDGAVLQYDLNSSNQWQNLGTIGDGINWFNSSTIQSQPGGQFFGWSSKKMDGWESARISLDAIRNAPNVRFRIAYATDGNAINPFDGFAFDDFWIGNRKKDILLEYFTNNTLASTIASNQYVAALESNNQLDLNAIHYHTSSPMGDPIYNQYPSGPFAKEFFYGISSVPFALVNGLSALNLESTAGNQLIIEKEILKDPMLNLSLECTDGEQIQIQLIAEANEGFSNMEMIVNCAIVQNAVEISNAPNGSPIFYNVIREFVPNPGGISMKGTMEKGEIFTYSYQWNPLNPSNVGNCKVLVFVQNLQTREIYQSATFDLSGFGKAKAPASPLQIEANIYPNPTSHMLWVDSPSKIEQATIYDLSGRMIKQYMPNSSLFGIPVDQFRNGVYLIRLKSSDGEIVKKWIKH
jgi:PKD repeat protein